MRMKIVTFLTCTFVAGVVVMAASADVKCAGGGCGYSVDGVGFSYAEGPCNLSTPENCPSLSDAKIKADNKAREGCSDDGCAGQCGGGYTSTGTTGLHDYPGSVSGGYAEMFWNPATNNWTIAAYRAGTCSCVPGDGFEGVPYGSNGVPVPLTFGQKIQQFIGSLFSRPAPAKPKPGGRS